MGGAPPPPLPLLPIRCHPSRPEAVVWAVGRFMFFHDSSASDDTPRRWEAHTDAIRSLDATTHLPGGILSSNCRSLWVSAGDDKQVIVWEEKGDSFDACFRLTHGKKLTVALFDGSGLVVFADRFG